MTSEPQKRTKFGSKFGVVAAAAGSAVGLGNIWKYPAQGTLCRAAHRP